MTYLYAKATAPIADMMVRMHNKRAAAPADVNLDPAKCCREIETCKMNKQHCYHFGAPCFIMFKL